MTLHLTPIALPQNKANPIGDKGGLFKFGFFSSTATDTGTPHDTLNTENEDNIVIRFTNEPLPLSKTSTAQPVTLTSRDKDAETPEKTQIFRKARRLAREVLSYLKLK